MSAGGRLAAVLSLAWRGVRRRALSSVLTALSVALGVGLTIAVATAADSAERSFDSLKDASRSYDVILGPPQGSPLQIVLVTLFHVDRMEGKFPWSVYEEYRPKPGKESPVAAAVPYAVGDTYRGHRVVGTSAEMFSVLHGSDGKPLGADVRGRLFADGNALEAVVGSNAAADADLMLGSTFRVTHGEEGGEVHGEVWTVVGVMRPTGSPHDRAIFIPMESFFAIKGHTHEGDHGHEKEGEKKDEDGKKDDDHDHDADHDHDHDADHDHDHDHDADHDHDHGDAPKDGDGSGDAHADEHDHDHEHGGRYLSAIGIRLKTAGLMKLRFFGDVRDKRTDVQAAMPEEQVRALKEVVGDLHRAFRGVAWLVLGVVLIGILVSLYNTIHGRRREIAVLRALGARPFHVFAVIVSEAVLLCLLGGLVGLLLGRGGAHAVAPMLQAEYGVRLDASPRLLDLQVLLAVLGLGFLAGVLPAWRGLRTPVAPNLHPTE